MATYVSANFDSMTNGDDLNTYTSEVGDQWTRATTSGSQTLLATDGRIRAGSTGGNLTVYFDPTTEPQLDIDLDFDIRIVTSEQTGDVSGAIARWEDGSGVGEGFAVTLVQTGIGTADLSLDVWSAGAPSSNLDTFSVSISNDTTYHVKYTLRSSGGNTSHKVYWDGSGSPDIDVASNSSGPQIAGCTGVVCKLSAPSAGYHVDNVVGTTTSSTPPTQPTSFLLRF